MKKNQRPNTFEQWADKVVVTHNENSKTNDTQLQAVFDQVEWQTLLWG